MKRSRNGIILVGFCVYCFFALWITILKRDPQTERKIVLDLFWAFRLWLSGSKKGARETLQYIKNILFFIPFGLLFPWKKANGWKVVLFSSVAFSMMIEILQYAFKLGWSELDDVISNSVGAMTGYAIHSILTKSIGDKDE